MLPTLFAPAFAVPSTSRLQFELQRVSRQGRLNLQAARAMAEELCGQARRGLPATAVAANFQRILSTDHAPAFVPPLVPFRRPTWRRLV